MRVPIAYNNWGDFDPHGRLFVLDQDRTELVQQVLEGAKAAGLTELESPLTRLGDALDASDPLAAVEATRDLNEETTQLLEADDTENRGRIKPAALARPLVVRANLGDCVAFRLTNTLSEPASIQVNGLQTAPGMGKALGNNTADLTMPGQEKVYRAYIPDEPAMEGAHLLQSHADRRENVRHGLFGALVAEPPGASWLSSQDASPLAGGAKAIVDQAEPSSDFREFVLFYHDEIILWNSKRLKALPEIDEFETYGPGTKGVNLRSEPFMDRFRYHDRLQDQGVVETGHDKSQAYGSYAYGDPASFIPESYVGEPTKLRVLNPGPGQAHVHHLHGGGIRWKTSPVATDTQFDEGVTKNNSQVVSESERRDVRNLNPGESFNHEPEGGAGGAQGTVGDLLIHCHIVGHYFAGMWTIWRVHDTTKSHLAPLPDRSAPPAAVDSTELIGERLPDGTKLTGENLDEEVETHLPAQGVPEPGDASVWNWKVDHTDDGPLYLGEPETNVTWPNYPADAEGRLEAGERPEILFNSETGKPAYPMLRPHFGKRPPFAAGHGPAPHLGPVLDERNPKGLCPQDADPRAYNLVSAEADVRVNDHDVDPEGEVFVHAQNRTEVENGERSPKSLVVRANRGDCVDVELTNSLAPTSNETLEDGITRKVNMHTHLVQFDIQGSDGSVVGFNYEQSVRSAAGATRESFDIRPTVTRLTGPPNVEEGKTTLSVANPDVFVDGQGQPKLGTRVGLNLTNGNLEQATLIGVDRGTNSIVLDTEVDTSHAAGTLVGYEFVNYRWFADVNLGTVYWHDHVDALRTWHHGLYGALIVEPEGSHWVAPERNTTLDSHHHDLPSRHRVDVVNTSDSQNESRNFRELVIQIQDRGCIDDPRGCSAHTQFPDPPSVVSEPSSVNLRTEPLWRRNSDRPLNSTVTPRADDPSTPVDERSMPQGDPATDVLEAYPGDATKIRLVYAGQTTSAGVGTFGLTGHRFPLEAHMPGSRPADTLSLGISSQYDLHLECGAGGCTDQAGDYLYYMTNSDMLERGAWGLIRVHDPANETPIQELPSNPDPEVGPVPEGPVRHYDVQALETTVTLNEATGETERMRVFATEGTVESASQDGLEPLVLRAKPGEIVEVNLHNQLDSPVSIHPSLLSGKPSSLGLPVGETDGALTPPGETKTYRWYVDREVGVSHLRSFGDPLADGEDGLYGALVVEPPGSSFRPATGAEAIVTLANGTEVREHVLLYEENDAQFKTSTMPYLPRPKGTTSINYRSAPWSDRTGRTTITSCQVDEDRCGDAQGGVRFRVRNPANAFAMHGQPPATPVIEADQARPLVLRLVGAAGDQIQVHKLNGHWWPRDWSMDGCRADLDGCNSTLVSAVPLGPREVANAWIPEAGPGGAGDYLYGSHRDAFMEDGAWGILRVGEKS